MIPKRFPSPNALPKPLKPLKSNFTPIVMSRRSSSASTSNFASVDPSIASPSSQPLYAQDSSIPNLPVPTIQSTAEKYLSSICPFFSTPKDEETSLKAIKDFISSPLVQELQKRLQARADDVEGTGGNWLADWWNELAYLGYRDGIVPWVNYYYLHKPLPLNLQLKWLRTSSEVHSFSKLS